MSMLAARSVTVKRGSRRVLEEVSIHVRPGEFVGVLGANGVGKSSLLAVLAGDLTPAAGQVVLDGQPLSHLGARALARRRAVLPQRAGLSFDMTVREVVAMGAYPFPALAPSRVAILQDDAMARAGVNALAARRYPDISGGEQQRVQWARVMMQVLAGLDAGTVADQHTATDGHAAADGHAVVDAANQPAGFGASHGYLLLDEPTASQDPGHQLQVLRAARLLAASGRVGVLAVLHDMNLAAGGCDRVVLLAEGRVLADGPPQDVLTAAHIGHVYDIEVAVIPHPLHAGRPLVVY